MFPVQRQPAPSALKERLQRLDLAARRQKVASVGDQKSAFGQPVHVGIIRRDAGPELGLLREQLQQLEPSEVDVVIFAGGNQVNVDGGRHRPSLRARLG